jgi:hypothetical protein
MQDLIRAMREYGEAIRGDWRAVNGRIVRDDISIWIEELEDAESGIWKSSARTLEELRWELGLCPFGNGHWTRGWMPCDKCKEKQNKE